MDGLTITGKELPYIFMVGRRGVREERRINREGRF